MRIMHLLLVPFFMLLLSGCKPETVEGCFPEANLPANIEALTSFGQRAEWSLDGRYVYFVDKAGGEIYRVNVKNKKVQQISDATMRPEGHGYYRILCLANGEFLLTCGPGRRETYMQIWNGKKGSVPHTLDETINEGPAISRKTMKITWTEKQETILVGEIVYINGIPSISNKKQIISNDSVVADGYKFPEDMLEPQSFRPGKENELIWSMYGFTEDGVFTSETMSYDTETGIIKNLSQAFDQYDEPEGIFPDGKYTLTECDRHRKEGTAYIDIYKMNLDDPSDYTRITYFSETEGYRASNPVVSDDGTTIAFQASLSGTAPGAGCGLYLLHLDE